ncbi:hypothetical protein ACJX0J_040054 [Zea mays]
MVIIGPSSGGFEESSFILHMNSKTIKINDNKWTSFAFLHLIFLNVFLANLYPNSTTFHHRLNHHIIGAQYLEGILLQEGASYILHKVMKMEHVAHLDKGAQEVEEEIFEYEVSMENFDSDALFM